MVSIFFCQKFASRRQNIHRVQFRFVSVTKLVTFHAWRLWFVIVPIVRTCSWFSMQNPTSHFSTSAVQNSIKERRGKWPCVMLEELCLVERRVIKRWVWWGGSDVSLLAPCRLRLCACIRVLETGYVAMMQLCFWGIILFLGACLPCKCSCDYVVLSWSLIRSLVVERVADSCGARDDTIMKCNAIL